MDTECGLSLAGLYLQGQGQGLRDVSPWGATQACHLTPATSWGCTRALGLPGCTRLWQGPGAQGPRWCSPKPCPCPTSSPCSSDRGRSLPLARAQQQRGCWGHDRGSAQVAGASVRVGSCRAQGHQGCPGGGTRSVPGSTKGGAELSTGDPTTCGSDVCSPSITPCVLGNQQHAHWPRLPLPGVCTGQASSAGE